MATFKNILFLFAILVPSTILAQEKNVTDSPPHPHDGSSEPPMPSAAAGSFDHFAFKLPNFDWSEISGFFGGGEPRQKRSPTETPPDVEHARQDQAFFRRVIRCNFATQGGSRCNSCTSVTRCYPFNMGTITSCGGLFPYCKNGQCSRTKGPLCTTTTTATTKTSKSTTKASGSSTKASDSSTKAPDSSTKASDSSTNASDETNSSDDDSSDASSDSSDSTDSGTTSSK